jgi:ACR3 family arsenite transporter
MVERLERHQIAVYLVALAAGAAWGLAAPASAGVVEPAITPVLAALLYATFLQVPFANLAQAVRDRRFLSAVLITNFVLVPLVVAVLVQFAPDDRAVRLGVLMVLLTPCIDYVIVFSGLAGGASDRLLAATPLLMLAQMLLLPVYLLIFLGTELAGFIEPGPFLEAFLILIVIPLTVAWLTQSRATGHRAGRAVTTAMNAAMVPLMALTLLVVVASQTPKISTRLGAVAAVIPLYAGFLIIMAGVGLLVARAFALDPRRARALIFTGATRNSLVVLPLALALPDRYAITAVIVVTQTLVELVGMVTYVRLVPRLIPTSPSASSEISA